MLIFTNATVVTGDGATVIDGGSVVVSGDRIIEVRQSPTGGGARDTVLDLGGMLLVPGAINSHAHGGTLGPLYASAAPGLPLDRALANLDVHLRGGTTTVLNVDGFALPDQVAATREHHPVNLKHCTTHFELSFEAARQADGAGLTDAHFAMTVETMLAGGAVAVGEIGAGHTLAGGGQDYLYIPNAIERETGVRIEPKQASALKHAVLGRRVRVDAYDRENVLAAIELAGLTGKITPERAREVIHNTTLPSFAVSLDGIREGAKLALLHEVPMLVHNSAPSEEAVYDAAAIAGPRLIACHTNHSTFTVEESVASGRRLRQLGAVVEACTLDAFGQKRLVPTPAHMYAMLAEDLVDIVTTDYAAGNWVETYVGLGQTVADGVISLPKAVQLATSNVARVFPRLAPDRGAIAPGLIADLAVCAGRLDQVRSVYVSGRLVCENGHVKR